MEITKQYKIRDLKLEGDQGAFSAVFATLNVVDSDGDLTVPGAFGEQRVIVSAYGHGSWGGALPVGKGRIYERGEEAIVEGRFFLDTQAGGETYKTVKNIGDLQEWSYALPEIDYEIREEDGERIRVLKRIKVNEVSPVLMGSGVNTRLLDIKNISAKRAFNSHSTATDDSAWSASTNEKRVQKDKPRSYYGKIYAFYDPDGEVGNKSTYKFIHHFIGENGNPGAASTRACSNGIAVLNGARGGTNIPDADRQGVWRHLSKHLRDADMEPPELRSLDANEKQMPLLDHIEVLLADASAVVQRIKDVADLREEDNRHPSESTLKRAGLITTSFEELIRELEEVREKHDEVYVEFLRYQKIISDRRRKDAC